MVFVLLLFAFLRASRTRKRNRVQLDTTHVPLMDVSHDDDGPGKRFVFRVYAAGDVSMGPVGRVCRYTPRKR